MAFEDSIEPLGRYLLGRFIPFTITAGGLHVPTKGGAQEKGGRLIVLKVGPDAPQGIKVGDRVLLSPHFMPTMLSKLDGYSSSDGSVLFLYPGDMVIAVMRGDDANAVVSES